MENNMKTYFSRWVLAGILIMASLAGCGGGSGGGGGTPAASTVVKGTVSAGIIYPGTVYVYAVTAAGAKGALLAGPVATNIDGTYNASLGPYSGAILLEASGTYTDESTGHTVTITAANPLRAMVDSVDNSTKNNRIASITPLTDLAWHKASKNGTTPTPTTAMQGANKLVDDLFRITDIIGTEPVRPDNASMANASQEAQAYTLALAALSNLASTASGTTDEDKLNSVLTSLEVETEDAESSGSMSSGAITSYESALTAVPLCADFPSARDQLLGMGKKPQIVTMAISGTLPAGTKIYAIQGTIALPVNTADNQLLVSLLADSNGKTLSDVLLLTGTAAGMAAAEPVATFLIPQRQMNFSIILSPTGAGIGTGDFAALTYYVSSSVAVTAADFSVVSGSLAVKDAAGADIAGLTLILK
ncbi:hypothetical protein FO488_15460 [Geobacter sp. FeAm09]|uniref:hypothetical protein n=1 Tax=Geobacter sp. FeAm09 TaxID=2597769 RepID=UPI0011EDA9C6|nr:hypothetical protein [Geobacter sp. FeAm09]QEM69411.1 hypothetical protein FO488_15460 [Geobacter sp. FeAm09]